MGRESSNYNYRPSKDRKSQFVAVLSTFNAERVVGLADIEGATYYVIRGDDYWIDLEVREPNEKGYIVASVRIAVCNPLSIESTMRRFFSELFAKCSGRLIDRDAREEFVSIDDMDWSKMWAAHIARRTTFQNIYGEFDAPISGGYVFKYMREVLGR
jgi:hypothetical protein